MPISQNFRNMPGGLAGLNADGNIFFNKQSTTDIKSISFGLSGSVGNGYMNIVNVPGSTLETSIASNGSSTAEIDLYSDGGVQLSSGTGQFYFINTANGNITFISGFGEEFMRIRRLGANDYRLEVKQGNAWVTK